MGEESAEKAAGLQKCVFYYVYYVYAQLSVGPLPFRYMTNMVIP